MKYLAIICDASMKLYALVVYLCVTGHNNIQTNLMFSNTGYVQEKANQKEMLGYYGTVQL